jgi:hypothetical protein
LKLVKIEKEMYFCYVYNAHKEEETD